MNTSQINCFLQAAKRLSFSGAASDLFLSPQAVSKQVISLENELNTRLFDRNGPKLRLTEIGVMYQRLFEGQERQFAFLREDVELHQKSLAMALRIGLSEWLDPYGEFGRGLQSFFAQKPATNFSLYHLSNNDLLESLLSGRVDCAFFSGAQKPDRRDMHCEVVAREDIHLFAPLDIGDGPFRFDCWGLPLLVTPAWSWIRTEYRVLCAREQLVANLTPSSIISMPNYQSLIAEMIFNRCTTLAGCRFSPYVDIDVLRGHPLGIVDDVVCLWPQANENPLLPELAEHLSGYFALN